MRLRRERSAERDLGLEGPFGLPGPLWRLAKVVGRSVTLLVGLASLTAAGAVLLLSQTVVGRSVVAEQLERVLAGVVNGEVRLGPILGGNMLTRAHLAHFAILEPDGTPFVELDSVRLTYNPLGFLVDTYRFNDITAQRARVYLRQAPDGYWNFDRLFGEDPTRPDDEPPADDSLRAPSPTRVLLTDLTIHHGALRVTTPWAADVGGAERDSLVARGLRGEKLWRVRSAGPDSWVREIRLDSLSGGFPLLRLVDPTRPFRIEAVGLASAASVVTQTLDVERFDGSATFRDTIAVEIDRLRTADTDLAGTGWVVPGDPEQFRFGLDADPLGFTDLQWLPVPLPDRGGGPARIDLWTRGSVIVADVSGADARVDDSRVHGSFVIALEDMPRFESLDLLLQPLRLRLADEVLDREPLIDGYVTGAFSGTGPIDLMEVQSDLTFADLEGASAPSFLTAEGGLSVLLPREMRDLRLSFLEFDPQWTRVFGRVHRVGGRVEGEAAMSGTVGQWLDFEADLIHVLPTGETSHLIGSGSVVLGDEPAITTEFLTDPLSLAALQPYAPPDVDLVGDVRGPLSARGLFSDLRVIADLRTPRGLVNFDGRFDLMAEERAYDARLTARDIQLRQWVGEAPSTRLAVEGRVRGVGTDPATLEATFDLTVLPSLVEGARVDTSLLRFTVSDGLATADTFAIQTDAGRVRGRGSFGLAEGSSGSLILDVSAPDLASWNRWIVPGRNPARQDQSLEDLFAAFPGEEGREEAHEELSVEPPDTLAGGAQALGVLYGNVRDFSFGGRLHGWDVGYGPLSSDSVLLTVDIDDPRRPDRVAARAALWRMQGLGTTLDSAEVLWERGDSLSSEIELYARRGTELELDTRARLRWEPDRKQVRLDRLAAVVGGQRLSLVGEAEIEWGINGFRSSGLELMGEEGGAFRVEGAVPSEGPVELDVWIRGLDLSSVFLAPDEPLPYGGVLDAEGRLRGTASDPTWTLVFEVGDPDVHGLRYERLEGDADYADGRMTLGVGLFSRGTLLGRLDGSVLADLSLQRVQGSRLGDDPLHLVLEADSLPMKPLELAFGSLRDVAGYGAGRIEFSGEPNALRLEGAATLADAAATVPYLGVRFEDVTASLTFDGTRAVVETGRLRSSAGGSASIAGSIDTRRPTDLGFELTFGMSRFRAMDRRMATFLLDGEGRLAGSYRSPELTGTFRLSEGQVRAERFLRSRRAVDLTDPMVSALIDTTLVMERRLFREAQNPFMQNLRMDAEIRLGPNFWLRSEALEVELAGTLDVRMDRAAGDLVAFGVLNLPRGKYRYVSGSGTDLSSLYSRQLQIAGGTIRFTGAPGMDPTLDIQAVYETRSDLGPVTITVDIGGTATAPTLRTSSDPPLPAADEVCFLLFSTACLGAGSEGGEFAASLVRESLLGTVGNQFSQVLVSGVGLVDYFDIRSTGQAGPLESGTTTNLLYGTEVEIGRYLTPDVYVRATQPLGGQLPGFGLEWSFDEYWRLEFVTEDLFRRYASYGYSFSSYSRRTYGLMLFRDWNF